MPLTIAERQARHYAKRKAEREESAAALADLTDVDWLTDVIADSLDEGWTPRDAAMAIKRRAAMDRLLRMDGKLVEGN